MRSDCTCIIPFINVSYIHGTLLCTRPVLAQKLLMEKDLVTHGFRIVTSKVLGEGQFGKVYLGFNETTGLPATTMANTQAKEWLSSL